ncbi:branched-chain-amino-acid transaminase [Planctomycetales bacterium ZRK34]|nr:branched-chain-amino-acid transaminase [Planctomycetales bacterium ZRK34]
MSEKVVWFNGEMTPADKASVSVFDHGLLYGDGVFEGIRAYNGRILKLRSHLKRLFNGASRIELKIAFTIEQLEQAVRATCNANQIRNGYIRLCVTRGTGYLGLNPKLCEKSNTFIIADSITLYPAEMYETGMPIITAKTMRNHPAAMDPAVKSMNYLNNILAKLEAVKANVPEALMLNWKNNVSECTGDNIFMISGGKLTTPPLSACPLPGITRALVIELARKADLPVAEEDFTLDTLYGADEIFLTGTAAEVIPVTKIDDKTIADGKPGPITGQLIAAFKQLVADAPED